MHPNKVFPTQLGSHSSDAISLDGNFCVQAQSRSGHQATPQMLAALKLLRAVSAAPGNPFVRSWPVVDFYAQYHFLHFARLFHELPGSGAPQTLCKAHLQVPCHISPKATSDSTLNRCQGSKLLQGYHMHSSIFKGLPALQASNDRQILS